jgi:hypothetical protein
LGQLCCVGHLGLGLGYVDCHLEIGKSKLKFGGFA